MAAASVAPVCPWGFLAPLAPPQPCPAAISSCRTTFAQALGNSKRHACDIPLSQLPIPCRKEDAVSVQIPEEEYRAGLESCRNNLHGRLLLSKGDAPLRLDDIRNRLLKLWSSIDQWSMIPLGKGFYEFSFASIEDLRKIWSIGACNLEPGILRLFAWSPDFHPSLVRQTNTQVWIRIFDLSQEYWRPKILFSIARAIGVPLSLDDATIKKKLGQYARVLVDVDLAGNLPDKVLVERQGYNFFVGIKYEKLPLFCDNCKLIGHDLSKCWKSRPRIVKRKQADKGKHVAVSLSSVPTGDMNFDAGPSKLPGPVDTAKEVANAITAPPAVDSCDMIIPTDPSQSYDCVATRIVTDPDTNANLDDSLKVDAVAAIDAGSSHKQANSCGYVADTSLDVSLATTEDYAHNEDPPPGSQQGEVLIGDTISGFNMNTPIYVHDDLSFFSEAVQNDVKVLSALWANQKDASTSKEDEQNNHNVDTEGFKMVKFKKKYHLRMNRKPNSRFA